jgi:hypothetical protein
MVYNNMQHNTQHTKTTHKTTHETYAQYAQHNTPNKLVVLTI